MQQPQQPQSKRIPLNKQPITVTQQVKKKSVLPFSKQLLSLQKKIQQVQDKNEMILQRIHKAYDFKKNKNKVYYQAPGYDVGQDQFYQEVDGEGDFYQGVEEYEGRGGNGNYYVQQQQQQQLQQLQLPLQSQQKLLQQPHYTPQQYTRGYQSIQPQLQYTTTIQQQQPRQFQISTARKSNSLLPQTQQQQQNRYYKNINIYQPPYLQHHQSQSQHVDEQLQRQQQQQQNNNNIKVPLILGLHSSPYYTQQYNTTNNNQYQPQYQQQQLLQQQQHSQQQQQSNSHLIMQSQSSQGQIDFKSNSNYSDVQKRKKISQNVKKRQKDFSDIKSSIEDRRTRPNKLLINKHNNHNTKKSYIYNVIENNSLYSEGNNVNSKQHLQGDDLQPLQTPITTQNLTTNFPTPRSPYRKPITPIPSQQRIGIQSQSANNDSHPNNFIPQANYNTISSLPPSVQMAYSVTARSPPYQSQVSSNQVNFLQQMFKTQRQKSTALQKQVQKKQQSIQHLKKYKKSFKRFFQDTHYVIEQAFDQFVETFLRNRVYKIQKVVKKNENRLSALMMQLKDFKQERVYSKSLKNLSVTKMGKKSLSINDQLQRRQSQQLTSQQQQATTEQNFSTISSRSRDRSVSGRKRRSQDKSVTKKSNQSQHIIMKKQFDTIAQNYQQMIKVKNQQLVKYQLEIKHAKGNIVQLQEQNSKLKMIIQQNNNQQQQLSSNTANTNTQSDNKRNSGNLRILSRNSSRSQIKKNSTIGDQGQQSSMISQLQNKIKKYKQQIDNLHNENSQLSSRIQEINFQYLQKQGQIEQLLKRIQDYEIQLKNNNNNNDKINQQQQQIDTLHITIKRLNEQNATITQKNTQLSTQIQTIKQKLNNKQIQILQLDSALYLKDTQLKKVENLLTLKTHKLEEFNKMLLQPSVQYHGEKGQTLNDSISSMMDDPHNKTTLLILENLEKQLQQEKYQKQIQFLKLKKSYQSKIEQLKTEFQQIADENQKLAQRLNNDDTFKKQSQQDKFYLQEINQHLKEEIQELHKQVTFLTDKINFYEIQRKTGSFAHIPKKPDTLLLQSETNFDHLKPHLLQEQDFSDFPTSEENQLKVKQTSNWKSASGEIKFMNQSNGHGSYKGKKSPSQQNHQLDNKVVNPSQINLNLQNKLSLLKDQNIDLSQKVAKFQKQIKFLKENQIQSSARYEILKDQLASFTKKYEELQLYNHQLLKIIQNLQKQKNQILTAATETHGSSPFDWKQIEKNVEPVDMKGSAMYSPWSFAQKEDFLLDRTSKDFDIRGSVVSSFIQNRPSKQSHENSDKKIEQLSKKLSQTQLLLENKEKINQQLIIGFTKKIDKINTQHQNQAKQQSKAIEKYIQQNSKLRKQKQKIEEEINSLKTQLSKLKQKLKNSDHYIEQNFDSGVEQIKISSNEDLQDGFGMMEQRIQGFQGKGFMLGINEDDQNEYNKTPQKQDKVKFSTILQQEDIQLQDFEQREQKIQLLQKQTRQLQQTIEKLQKFLQQTLNKVKQKQDEKTVLVEELQKKNQQVDELRDLIQLKEVGKNNNLSISKQLNGIVDRPSIEKSHRSRMNSVISLKYSQTHHGQRQRRASFDDEINFDFLQSNNNQSINLDHSRMSAIYSQNMSMIFEKQQNFLDQIKKAKNKRKQQGRLLKKTFQYIKKLRNTLNEKNKKIKLLEMRLQELKDNCWLWKKSDDKRDEAENIFNKVQRMHTLSKEEGDKADSQQHNYLDHNQSLSDQDRNKLVDSRVFQCNSEDLNKKKPYRHNHYKKMEFDTKLIVEENKILNKQIQLLQQELVKIQEQQNGLMAVKELYKEEIRALTRQNQQQSVAFQQQIQKFQDKLESSEAVHNFEAIKQLFKKIIDSIGVILYPATSPESKKKNIHQLKEEKRKQAQQCIKVICSILNYEGNIKNQICQRLSSQQQMH